MLDKDKLLEMAKNRGIELAEETAEQMAKGGAHLIIDLFGELVKSTENKIDDVAFAAIESQAREMADKIDVTL